LVDDLYGTGRICFEPDSAVWLSVYIHGFVLRLLDASLKVINMDYGLYNSYPPAEADTLPLSRRRYGDGVE